MNNICFFWGGLDVIPLILFYESLGMNYSQGNELLKKTPKDSYGEANYCIIKECDIHVLIGNQYKNKFNKNSDKDILCIDKTIATILVLVHIEELFKKKGLRSVK